MSFLGTTDSEHEVLMDAPPEVGGQSSGPRPIDLFLIGLGGCTAMDVVSILRKMKVEFVDFGVEIVAERAPEHPKVYTQIELIFSITGDSIPEDKFTRAIELSQEKYCSAAAMLEKTADMKVTHKIVPAQA
jgi:putative redox protein